MIPTIISQGLRGGKVGLGNLTPTRDLTYVSDTVEGFLCAGSADGIEGRTINLGTGREVSIGDLVDLIGDILGQKLECEVQDERVRPKGSEVERLLSDNTLARKLMGWAPAVTLEEGLARTVEWVRDNREEFRRDGYVI